MSMTLVNSDYIVAWVRCDCCDDYICYVCSTRDKAKHVADCDCPRMNTWADHGVYPYGPMLKIDIDAMLALEAEKQSPEAA